MKITFKTLLVWKSAGIPFKITNGVVQVYGQTTSMPKLW